MTLQDAFTLMYNDLLCNRLEVVLVPSNNPDTAKDGGMIRVPVSKNPEWYTEFCLNYKRSGKARKNPRTIIKRVNVLQILDRLRQNKPTYSKYVTHLSDIAEKIRGSLDLSEDEVRFLDTYGELPKPFTDQF